MTFYTLFAFKNKDNNTDCGLFTNGESNDSYIKNRCSLYTPISLTFDDTQFVNILDNYKGEPILFLICSADNSDEFISTITKEFDNKTYVDYNKDLVDTCAKNWAFNMTNIDLYKNELNVIKTKFNKALNSSTVSICIHSGFEYLSNINKAIKLVKKELESTNNKEDISLYGLLLNKWETLQNYYIQYLTELLNNNVHILYVPTTHMVSSIINEDDINLTNAIYNVTELVGLIRLPNYNPELINDIKEYIVKTIIF